MADVNQNELVRLAEADGATFQQTPTGAWWAKDRDGIVIVRGALSKTEAAVLYCEDRDLTAATPEAILARIKHEFRPYDTMTEFDEGFAAYQNAPAFWRDPYDEGPDGGGVKAQAFDRGANAAMLYARALAHLDAHKEDVEKAGPGWLATLLRTGRC
jgi:hypothetical protein